MTQTVSSPLFRKILRNMQLVNPAFQLKTITKFEAAIPAYGAGHTGLRCAPPLSQPLKTVFMWLVLVVCQRGPVSPRAACAFLISRSKFVQNQVGLFKFNSPSLSTQFTNTKAKEAAAVLKLVKSMRYGRMHSHRDAHLCFDQLCCLLVFFLPSRTRINTGSGEKVELNVAKLREGEIVKLIKAADSSS